MYVNYPYYNLSNYLLARCTTVSFNTKCIFLSSVYDNYPAIFIN